MCIIKGIFNLSLIWEPFYKGCYLLETRWSGLGRSVRFHISCSWKNEVRSAMMGTRELSNTTIILLTPWPCKPPPFLSNDPLACFYIDMLDHTFAKKELHGLILTGSSWQFSSWAICHSCLYFDQLSLYAERFLPLPPQLQTEFLQTTLLWHFSLWGGE